MGTKPEDLSEYRLVESATLKKGKTYDKWHCRIEERFSEHAAPPGRVTLAGGQSFELEPYDYPDGTVVRVYVPKSAPKGSH